MGTNRIFIWSSSMNPCIVYDPIVLIFRRLKKGHNNTAAKQLPLWLRPAVPTIRSYLYAAHQTRGLYFTPHAMRLYIQLTDDSLPGNHWFNLLS